MSLSIAKAITVILAIPLAIIKVNAKNDQIIIEKIEDSTKYEYMQGLVFWSIVIFPYFGDKNYVIDIPQFYQINVAG